MGAFSTFVMGLPVLAAGVMAGASYPSIPTDLTTPVQQRIAINGPNGNFFIPKLSASPWLMF
jgi:acid phosphatase type 7